MSTKRKPYPAGALNLPVAECPHWRAMCLPLPHCMKNGDKAFDDCGGVIRHYTLKSLDTGDTYWVIIVDIGNCDLGVGPEMPKGWDYRKFMRAEF